MCGMCFLEYFQLSCYRSKRIVGRVLFSQTAGDRSRIHDRKVTDKSGALDCLAFSHLLEKNKKKLFSLVFIIFHQILLVFLYHFVTL